MYCENCDAEMRENETKCSVCGAVNEPPCNESETSTPIPVSSSSVTKNFSIWSLIGLIAGIIFIIVGFSVSGSAEANLDYASFGGDFYTYAYRGLRAAESAIVDVTKEIGSLIVAVGAFMSCYFGKNLKK